MPGVPTPPTILAAFGFSAGSSYITTPIPYGTQQPNPRASYTDGFPPQTVGGSGTPPDVRDFNGILHDATANIAAFSAGQYFPFSSAIASQNSGYAGGAIIATADGTGFWLNTNAGGNTNNPDTSSPATSGWVSLTQYGLAAITGLTNANVTLTAPQAAKPIITLAGTLTGNVQIIFPPWINRWVVQNKTTSSGGYYTVTCKTASGTGVIVPPGQTLSLWGDGTNINSSSYVSGSFTGTFVGFSSTVTATVLYEVGNGLVSLTIPSTAHGTSNTPSFSMTGIPVALLPTTQSAVVALGYAAVDNGSPVHTDAIVGEAVVAPTSIVFLKNGADTGWTSSGNKGFLNFASKFTYSVQ